MDRLFGRLFPMVLFISLLCPDSVRADEGMWPLPWREGATMDAMKVMGCTLSAEDIYSTRKPSLKDAVVIFGGGCTGEVVSPQGLVLTNYHCGYEAIQTLSSVKHDYLTKGYWAESFGEELPASGITVTFLVSTEDVTKRLRMLDDSLRSEGSKEGAEQWLIQQRSRGNRYQVRIIPMFERNNKYLYVYQEYQDVRLVGTPSSSIGRFGGETDNWVWPRHTGDFSLFRIYADVRGNPAAYSKENVPLITKAYLPLSLKGVRQGDFTFIMGFPGSTSRYIPSFVAQNFRDITYPVRIKVRAARQLILEKRMQKKSSVRIQYAAKYASSANYYKNYVAQMEGFARFDLVSEKRAYEQELQRWIESDSARKRSYGSLLKNYEALVKERMPLIRALQYYREALLYSTEYLSLAQTLEPLYMELEKTRDVADKEGIMQQKSCDSLASVWAKEASESFAGIDRKTDKKVTQVLLSLFKAQVPSVYLPSEFTSAPEFASGNMEAYTHRLFARSILTGMHRRQRFIKHPSLQKLQNDPLVVLALSVAKDYQRLTTQASRTRLQMDDYARLFMAMQLEKEPSRVFYPDANFTMRLTYGMVDGYSMPGGRALAPFTSLAGVMNKEKRGDWEFSVPARLRLLYRLHDFGRYETNGDVPVCFLTSTDISGGNSGSPVMNAKGELIGIAFDGNWEGALGDLLYDEAYNRTINVDIRYVLFIMDKFAGATRLLREMEIRE